MIFTGKQTAWRGNVCGLPLSYVSAFRQTTTVFWQWADRPDFVDNVLLANRLLQWQTLQRKGVLLSHSDHSSVIFSVAITMSVSLSSLRDPSSSILRPRRPNVAFPRGWGASMELAGCKGAGSSGEPRAAIPEGQSRMRGTLVMCRALPWPDSQGWHSKCLFSFSLCWRHNDKCP